MKKTFIYLNEILIINLLIREDNLIRQTDS